MMTTIITIISNPPVTDPGSVENHSSVNDAGRIIDACEPGQTLSNSKGSHMLGKPSFANSAVSFNIVQTAVHSVQHAVIGDCMFFG